ncbi:Druantia anti-phage system protein DruA [Nitrosomonas sp.]|uniref:Druantia anti-phage system protein DruA n=1 Tax=Nitrosomonas sp. TaxID=42353 RepID=UPI00351FE08C
MRDRLSYSSLQVAPVHPSQERNFQDLMQAHHYLGALPKIENTIWYVATAEDQWLALLSFSAPALKCSARDEWIGWSYRHQYDRLNLVANNSRFLILPEHHHKNLALQALSHCKRRIQQDWLERFGYPLLLLETFVGPDHFHGTIYRASNWILAGATKGYWRTRGGYSEQAQSSKWVFMLPLQRNARALLSRLILVLCLIPLPDRKSENETDSQPDVISLRLLQRD